MLKFELRSAASRIKYEICGKSNDKNTHNLLNAFPVGRFYGIYHAEYLTTNQMHTMPLLSVRIQ